MSLDNFQILNKVGDGTYSIVYKVRRLQDDTIYALKQVKLIDLPPKQIQNAVNQVRILASIRHPNIIGYRQAFYDKSSKSLCIIMQYADGGDLLQKMIHYKNKGQYFQETYIWDVFTQIISGLAKLHQLGILHRDIKTANVFLMRNGTAKLGDMNVSKVVKRSGMCQTQTGTPYYASPQVWRDQAYDSKSDMWSLGCVLYQFINLKLPFRARDMQGLYRKVSRGYYSRMIKDYSDQFAQILKLLIKLNPKQRIASRDLLYSPIIKKNMKKHRQLQSKQKSVLLKTIKISKNINFIDQKFPKNNYAVVQEKCHYYNRSMSLDKVTDPKKAKQYSGIIKVKNSLPPLPKKRGNSLILSNLTRVSSKSNIKSSQIKTQIPQIPKASKRYKLAKSKF